jgi:hypothetical protein
VKKRSSSHFITDPPLVLVSFSSMIQTRFSI